MDLGLKGKRALVLGSSAGIGLGIAKALLAEDCIVCLSSRSEERLQVACKDSGAQHYVVTDLREKDAGMQVVKSAIDEMGGVDILVTNSGGPSKGTFAEIQDSDWEQQFQNLLLSTIQSIRTAAPGMQERNWGRVLLITSVAAKEPIANLTISNVLRSGLLGLVNTVSNELAASGVTVNTILPGYTLTDRLQELGRDLHEIAQTVPAKRLGTPEELGDFAAFLCSERAGYITGQAICYDGGLTTSI